MWTPKTQWLDKSKGLLLVRVTNGHEYEMTLTEEGIAYYNTEGCKCGVVAIPELLQVIVSGQDDCLVHGFQPDLEGDENEDQ